MNDSSANPPRFLVEAASVLRTCQPLSDRLVMEGVTIELSEQDKAHLLSFEKLVQADFNESEWSYLRVASGVKLGAVAALKSCLTRYRASEPPSTYGKLY